MIQEILMQLTGAILIWAACDVKRKEESKVKIGSKYWFLQLVLIIAGVTLYKYATH